MVTGRCVESCDVYIRVNNVSDVFKFILASLDQPRGYVIDKKIMIDEGCMNKCHCFIICIQKNYANLPAF